jgi:hypothetical protein
MLPLRVPIEVMVENEVGKGLRELVEKVLLHHHKVVLVIKRHHVHHIFYPITINYHFKEGRTTPSGKGQSQETASLVIMPSFSTCLDFCILKLFFPLISLYYSISV